MLGFSCSGSSDLNLPLIQSSEEKILARYLELYKSRGNVLDKLILQAKNKLDFSEKSVRFWAPFLIEGNLGPLQPFLSMDLEEIMVNGIEKSIFVYDRKKGMLETNVSISSETYFLELANRMLSSLGRRINSSNPRESGILSNGDRVAIAIPPYSRDCVLSVRRYLAEPFTILDLVDLKMLSHEAAAFLWTVMESGNINVGLVGNTGSGKTTLLNSLLRFVPADNRMILVEDIPEIRPLQDQVVRLISNKNLGISMRDAILDSLRLRPDRVVIGEVRADSEVDALRESCLAGHAMGTYFTYHADSSERAYSRLISQGFPEYDLSAIPLLVVCRRYERGGKLFRRVVEIVGDQTIFTSEGRVGDFNSKYWRIAFDDPWKEVNRRAEILRNLERTKDLELFEVLRGTL